MRFFLHLIFLLPLMTFGFSPGAHAQSQVVLENIPPELQQKIKNRFPEINAGDLPPAIIDQILRLLSEEENYDVLRAEKTERGLVIRGELRKVVGEVTYSGNASLSRADFEPLLKIKKGERFDRKLALESGEAIKEIYGESGFFNAVVEIQFEQQPDGSINVSFAIQENEPCRIGLIDIYSPNSELQGRLKNRVQKYIRKNLTQQVLDRIFTDLRGFFTSRGFYTAHLKDPKITYNENKTTATVSFEVQDAMKWEFNIEGNQDKTLAEIYSVLDLSDRERKNIDPVSESIDRLRRYYLSQGYPHVNIETRVIKLEAAFVQRVYLKITEGPRVTVEKYVIEGRVSRPSAYYVDVIESYSSQVLDRGYYNRDDLDSGLENLMTHLKNQGFLKSRVQSVRVEFSEDRTKATVVINMDEGSLTQIRSVTFEGNNFFSARELDSVVGLESRGPLRLIELETGIQKIKEFYQRQGFMEMKLLNEDESLVAYNPKGTLAEINFKIYEGPRIRIAEVVIDGNSFTKTHVIRREADFEIGEVLNPEAIENATDRLNRLGIFSRVEIRTLEEGTAIADRTLIISVAERDPGVFRIGAGVNSERDLTARGFVGLGYNNLWGTARAISGRAELNYNIAQINYPEYEVSGGYLEPFIFGTRNKARFNLSRSERVFEYSAEKRGLTSITQSDRAEMFIERQFSQTIRGTWRFWSIDRRKDFEKNGRCIENYDSAFPDRKCNSSVQQIAKIGPIVDIDYRDNPFLPTKGTFTRALFEYSHPSFGSTERIHFAKADTQFSKYTRLGNTNVIWANSLRGGYLRNLDSSPGSGIPANQAFFLGGIFTVRGFDSASNNERIPPEWELGVPKSTTIVVEDDSYYGLLKSEFRFPISGDHGGVIFYDGGIVQVTGVDISRPYRDAVGFGYRYNTPVGPVSLDFAFKINPRRDKGFEEDPFRIHFSIGTF